MKRTITRAAKSKHTKRSLAFIATLSGLAVVIFVFTRPLLAPELGTELIKSDPNNGRLDQSETFDAEEDILPSGVGENIKADSFLVFDESTGQIIASHNSKTPVAIASITKLMTAYVTQKYGDLTDTWAITSASTIDIRPVLGLVPGDRVVIKDLVDGMLIGSANDAASALGGYLNAVTKKPAIEPDRIFIMR